MNPVWKPAGEMLARGTRVRDCLSHVTGVVEGMYMLWPHSSSASTPSAGYMVRLDRDFPSQDGRVHVFHLAMHHSCLEVLS